jgi:site-specific DNA recombinase
MTTTEVRCAAIYARISKDDDDENASLGVGRQVADCVKLARTKGWHTSDEPYVDNNVSASNGKARPAYERLLADLEAGRVDAVICWDVDRLTRRPIELEHIIDLAERRGVELASVGGEIDLATPQGRLTARIKGSVARHEVEQSRRRIRSAFDEKAHKGEPHGIPTYGWRRVPKLAAQGEPIIVNGRVKKHDVIDEEQAAVIREATRRVLGGESLRAIAMDLNNRKVRSPRGGPWGATTLRQILKRERNAGLRVHRKEIVGNGDWEPIVTRDEFDRLRAMLSDPNRRTNAGPHTAKYLLAGIVRCGVCDVPMRALVSIGANVYTCQNVGCFKVRRNRPRVDDLVTKVVVGRLAQPDAIKAIARALGDDSKARDLTDQRDALQAKLDLADDDYDADRITHEQHLRITSRTRSKLDATKAELSAALGSNAPDLLDLCRPDIAEIWEDGVPLERKRAVINALVEIKVMPVGSGKRWDPRSVKIKWRRTRPNLSQ